ncbi:MAG: putative ABC transporter permease [Lachnospiraceae bacterium]|nr:putative ABC transporter permease [Lachnospiraceae bacterium]
MIYQGWELLWLFFIYSVLGWVLETAAAAVKQKRFVNRGVVNSPLCVVYGAAAVLITVLCQELTIFWLFLGSAIYATTIEWIAGHFVEKLYHERWWDYSGLKWNFDGYVCIPMSLLWGALGVAGLKWGNPLFLTVYRWMPGLLGKILLCVLTGIVAVDIAATVIIRSGRSSRIEKWRAADAYFDRISDRWGRWIVARVDERINRAYPYLEKKEEAARDKTVFAQGCDFYKIVLLFFVGAFLGDITETIFCRITAGVWMSRSSVVWGPFSIVWGLAIAAVTAMLYRYKDRSDGFLFFIGTFLGGAYEYLCSVFTEIVFGTVFWDYSEIPFNLGGRINLLYCFFWGIAAVVWIKKIYPYISGWIEKIPVKPGKVITWLLILFMICNMIMSGMALLRYNQRHEGVPVSSGWQKTMDVQFDDARMERIYPNAKMSD